MREFYPNGMNIEMIRSFTKQILRALKFLKGNGILHRDVKPENILINRTNNSLKVCDFGNGRYESI